MEKELNHLINQLNELNQCAALMRKRAELVEERSRHVLFLANRIEEQREEQREKECEDLAKNHDTSQPA